MKDIKDICGNSSLEIIHSIQKAMSNLPADITKLLHRHVITYMPKAKYSTKNTRHFALGFDCYSHFTSPIRRYSDLILHRILKEILVGNMKKLKFLSSNLDVICDRLNLLQSSVNKIEWTFKDRKFARFYKNKIDNSTTDIIEKCIVIDNGSSFSLGKIVSNGAMVFLDKKYGELSVLEIIILSSDIVSGRIYAKGVRLVNVFNL